VSFSLSYSGLSRSEGSVKRVVERTGETYPSPRKQRISSRGVEGARIIFICELRGVEGGLSLRTEREKSELSRVRFLSTRLASLLLAFGFALL